VQIDIRDCSNLKASSDQKKHLAEESDGLHDERESSPTIFYEGIGVNNMKRTQNIKQQTIINK
jgi:hypothetical protein